MHNSDVSIAQEADFAKFAFRPTTVVSGKPKRCIAIFLKLLLAHRCSILASYRSAVWEKPIICLIAAATIRTVTVFIYNLPNE